MSLRPPPPSLFQVNLAIYTPVCLPPEKAVASLFDGMTATAVGKYQSKTTTLLYKDNYNSGTSNNQLNLL